MSPLDIVLTVIAFAVAVVVGWRLFGGIWK